MYKAFALYLLLPLISCGGIPEEDRATASAPEPPIDTVATVETDTVITQAATWDPQTGIRTGGTDPEKVIAYSKTLKGVPYKYAAADPASGFDCSGFITYVFNHFGISVPRTSTDFTNQGRSVDLSISKPGDLILFTGTDSTIRTVGHMGIITSTGDSIVFIHSTSGKAYGVTETTLNPYYMGRFMKVIRVFE
jgi:cell wall-associated NlpC family hydrolase